MTAILCEERRVRMKTSGQGSLVFSHCEDLRRVPDRALGVEINLHGGFAVDKRAGKGSAYYGMPGIGLMRISPDLSRQDIIDLPAELRPMNFHSTRIGALEGEPRLFLPANDDAKVAVLTMDGELEYLFERPEFDEYRREGVVFRPTDTALVGTTLYVADGYGANYVSTADMERKAWVGIFGGPTNDPEELGRYGTAHGLTLEPTRDRLAIADRPHSRIQIASFEGDVAVSHALPAGSRPCGIDYIKMDGRWYAVVGSLDDPAEGRPAPIYVLDAETYEVLSTIRPKEDLGVDRADHIHNVVWHQHGGNTFLLCQSWNPGYYFVLRME
jgi:hypothetical protein